jgi:hypothetical protein
MIEEKSAKLQVRSPLVNLSYLISTDSEIRASLRTMGSSKKSYGGSALSFRPPAMSVFDENAAKPSLL